MLDKEDPAVADTGDNISVAGDMANLQLRSPKPDSLDGDAPLPEMTHPQFTTDANEYSG